MRRVLSGGVFWSVWKCRQKRSFTYDKFSQSKLQKHRNTVTVILSLF